MANVPDLQVTCITKSKSGTGYEAITHVGGINWKWSVATVIAAIKNKTHTFYTRVGGYRADIGVVDGKNGPYLQTYADGKWNNNLLALDECP